MKIAVCEDNNIVAAYLEDYLSSLGVQNIEYEIFTSGDDLIHYMEQEKTSFNIFLMDIEMPVMNGLDAAAIIHKAMPETHIVFLTAFDRFDYAVGAMRAGGTDYLVKPFDSAQITACLRKLNLLPESRPAVRGDKPGNTFCTQFSVWLEHHYMQDVSLDQAAEAMGMSSFYFSRFFRTSYNQTFLEYLTAYRIDRAVELLQQTDIPVREIAVRVGYTDANYFTKVFKRHLGVTPTEYRNHNAN